MTDPRNLDDDIHIPGLENIPREEVSNDTDDAPELLEGLLGPNAADQIDSEGSGGGTSKSERSNGGLSEDILGRWACRFCQAERRKPRGLATHHATCPESQFYRDHNWENEDDYGADAPESQSETEDSNEDVSQAGGDTPGEQRTYLVDTSWHEFRAYLKFGRHGLQPYYELHKLMQRLDWSDDPPAREIEYGGHGYQVTFTYQESQLQPWRDETFKIQNVREFRLHLETADGIRKADFHIRPRWPNMESKEGMATPTNPREFIGVDVDVQGANHEPSSYPELLDIAMQAFGVNGGATDQKDRYLSPANVEPWSIVIDGERYVRIHNDHSGRLIGLNGPLEGMNRILASDRSGYRKHVADDQGTAGYYHTVTFGSKRTRKILDGHAIAKEIKHYHVKHPDCLQEDDPLRHPKLGVSYQRSHSDTRVYWNREALESDRMADSKGIGLGDMGRELDEQLLNTLNWAGLPTRPDKQVFVDDAVFSVQACRRTRTIVPNPLPRLEEKQEHMVTRALTKMCDPERYDTDARMVKTLLMDGGEKSPQTLAKDLGVHYETILRSLKRLEDIVEHSYGSVELKSNHLAQQLAERAGDLLGDFGRWHEHVHQLGEKVARFVEGTATEDSPFDLWVEKYLEDVYERDTDPRVFLRMGYRPADAHEARDILRRGVRALRSTFGSKNADASRIVRKGQAEISLIDGTPVHMEFAPEVT